MGHSHACPSHAASFIAFASHKENALLSSNDDASVSHLHSCARSGRTNDGDAETKCEHSICIAVCRAKQTSASHKKVLGLPGAWQQIKAHRADCTQAWFQASNIGTGRPSNATALLGIPKPAVSVTSCRGQLRRSDEHAQQQESCSRALQQFRHCVSEVGRGHGL